MTTLNLGHVSIFYQLIFPLRKQFSIESPPRKQRLENDAKEREKQTIVAKKPVSRPNNASSDRRSLQKFHRKQSVCSKFHQMWGRQSRREHTYVPRYLCSPVLMFPGTYVPRYLCSPVPMFPGTYVPRYLCSPVPMFPDLRLTTAP